MEDNEKLESGKKFTRCDEALPNTMSHVALKYKGWFGKERTILAMRSISDPYLWWVGIFKWKIKPDHEWRYITDMEMVNGK